MNFELDDLLDMVDEWKFKLHDKLAAMTPKQRAAFWKRARDKARAAGFLSAEPESPSLRRPRKRGRRITGNVAK